MQRSFSTVWHRQLSVGFGLLLGLVTAPQAPLAQGCMPLRFTSPSVGGEHVPFLEAHTWEFGVAARRVATHRFYLGTHEDEALSPGGQPLYLGLNSLDLSLSYATSDRLSFTFVLPLSYSTVSSINADLNRHKVSSMGVGDINLMGNLWLWTPGSHPNGNVIVGVGVKAPTGSNHVKGDSYGPGGVVTQTDLQQTVQLGDGGWATLLQAQAFQRVFTRTSVYASGLYSVSLRRHTDVFLAPNIQWAVPDVYSARLGFAYGLIADPALTMSLGGRVDGTPTRDLIGGRTDYFRHAGYTMYIDPGLSYQMGPNQFNLNVPVRLYHNYLNMTLSDGTVRLGEGGVNDFVIYAGWTRRL